MIYAALRFIFRVATYFYFSRIEVEGKENFPDQGPVVLVPNHPNALMDPVMIAVRTNRRISLTGKSTLEKLPVVRELTRAVGLIPIYRRQDIAEGADPGRNDESLSACRKRLAEGGAICIFPEGISHSDPQLKPLKTGAARIALGYADEYPDSPVVRVIPVGLNHDRKEHFRSRVCIRFGEPILLDEWQAANPKGGAKELTAEIDRRLRAVTLNFQRRDESLVLGWAAEVLATGAEPPPKLGREREKLGDRIERIERLQHGYEKLQATRSAELDALAARIRRYRIELKRLGIRPAEVYLKLSAPLAARFVIRELTLLILSAPLALWGIINLLPGFALVRFLAGRYGQTRDQFTTYGILGGIIFMPLFAIAQTLAVGILESPEIALVYFLLLPVSEIAAIAFAERTSGAIRRARTYLGFVRDHDLQGRLALEGAEIVERIRELADELPPAA